MTTVSSSDWSGERGRKWSRQVTGIEASLAPVDDALLAAMNLKRKHRVADVACGGGGTTLAIAREAPPGSVIHGYDISPDVLDVARARTDDPQVAFRVADVSTAPVPEQPYDRLCSRFGVMFFEDPAVAFANLTAWLIPGGRLAFAVWGNPAGNPWMTSATEAVATVVQVPESESDPDAPGRFRYSDASKLTGLLRTAGFTDLDVSEWRGRLPVGGGMDAGAAARFTLSVFSDGAHLEEAGEAAVEQGRAELAARLAEHERDGVVQVDALVNVVTGSRS